MGTLDDVRAAIGWGSCDELLAVHALGEAYLADLVRRSSRAPQGAYVEEIEDLGEALRSLGRRALRGLEHRVRFRAPERLGAPPTPEQLAMGLGRSRRGDVVVIRTGQLMVRRNGRARVEDAYTLYIGGRAALGPWPAKPLMRQATFAAARDGDGALPETMLLRGRQRQRYLHRRRRARRELVAARRRAREKTSRTGQLHVVGSDVRIVLTMDGRAVDVRGVGSLNYRP